MRRMLVVTLLAISVAGCAGGAGEGAGADGDLIAVTEVIEGVDDYYLACRNEVLVLPDGRSFYPLPSDVDRAFDEPGVDESRYEDPVPTEDAAAPSGGLVAASVTLAVVAPGPGDTTGTLTVYEDGTAFWRSDSGIEGWLTDVPQTYMWMC